MMNLKKLNINLDLFQELQALVKKGKNMIRQELINYIKIQTKRGQSSSNIKSALLSAGWQPQDIEDAMAYANSDTPPPLPQSSSYTTDYCVSEQASKILTPPSILLSHAWEIYKKRFKTFSGIVIVPVMLVIILIGILLAGAIAGGILNSPALSNSAASNIANWELGLVLVIIFILSVIVLQIWAQTSLLYAIKDREENIGVVEAYKRGFKKIGSYFWVSLLSTLIIFGGFLFFAIPGVIFSIWFSFAVIIVIAEGIGGMNALLKSKEYVKGYWWEILWRFIFIGLILMLLNLVFIVPIGFINFIAALTQNSAFITFSNVISMIPNIIFIFITPLTAIYTFLIYKELKQARGEVTSVFSSGQKVRFILVGIVGTLVFIGMLAIPFLMLSFVSSIGSAPVKTPNMFTLPPGSRTF